MLEALAVCCAIRDSPRPLLVCSGGAVDASYRVLSSIVLHNALTQLMPTAVALQVEVLHQKSVLPPLLTTRGGPDIVSSSLSPHDHESLMAKARGNPFCKMLLRSSAAHSAAYHGGGWTYLYLISSTLRRLLWVASEAGNHTVKVARDMTIIGEWMRELVSVSVPLLIRLGVVRHVDTTSTLRSFVYDQLRLQGWYEDEESDVTCNATALNSSTRLADQITSCVSLCTTKDGGQLQPSRVQFRCLHTSEQVGQLGRGGKPSPNGSNNNNMHVLRGMFLPWQLSLENQHLLAHRHQHNNQGTPPPPLLPTIRVLLIIESIVDQDIPAILAFLERHHQHTTPSQPPMCCWLIACQKTISALAQSVLYAEQVVALERLSERFVEPLCHTAGCCVVASAGSLASVTSANVIGLLDDIIIGQEHGSIGGRYRAFFMGRGDVCTMHTVVLFHSNPARHAMIEEQSRHAFLALCQLFAKGAVVVAGGGEWEGFVAQYLRCRYSLTLSSPPRQRPDRSVVFEVAGALDSFCEKMLPCSFSPGISQFDRSTRSHGARQLASLLSKRPVHGCAPPPGHPSPPPSEMGQASPWRGLPPLAESSLLAHLPQIPIQSNWKHFDSFWSKQGMLSDYPSLLHTILSVQLCHVDLPQ